MWINRDFDPEKLALSALPIKVLRGPRQVGKTSLLSRLASHKTVFLDDVSTRIQAQDSPRFFFDQLPGKVIIDEATLAPNIFSELKRRIDEARRSNKTQEIDIWLTGSNQVLVQRNVRESLAGRASYFSLSTLSIHELGALWSLPKYLMRGGWPELYVSPQLDPFRYLNDFIATFIEKDIIAAAGIDRQAAFTKVLHLAAGRVGQLLNASDIASNAGVDSSTVSSWLRLLATSGVLQEVPAYFSNFNKRLTKAPKFYFCDISLATRLQGWTTAEPIIASPLLGHLFENIVLAELTRFFLNRGIVPNIHFVRSKEKDEVDFLVDLGNQRFLAIEAKVSPTAYTSAQHALLDSLNINIVERWLVSCQPAMNFPNIRCISIEEMWDSLCKLT